MGHLSVYIYLYGYRPVLRNQNYSNQTRCAAPYELKALLVLGLASCGSSPPNYLSIIKTRPILSNASPLSVHFLPPVQVLPPAAAAATIETTHDPQSTSQGYDERSICSTSFRGLVPYAEPDQTRRQTADKERHATKVSAELFPTPITFLSNPLQ